MEPICCRPVTNHQVHKYQIVIEYGMLQTKVLLTEREFEIAKAKGQNAIHAKCGSGPSGKVKNISAEESSARVDGSSNI